MHRSEVTAHCIPGLLATTLAVLCNCASTVGGAHTTADGGATDAGTAPDLGTDVPVVDAGMNDTLAMDTAPMDAGPMDVGTTDVRAVDVGSPPDGPPDCGVGSYFCDGMCMLDCDDPPFRCPIPDSGCFACVDPQSDGHNCGACNHVCPSGQLCFEAECVTSCISGETACGTVCTNLQTDNANCGGCGNVCCPGLGCSVGECSGDCETGMTMCGLGPSQRSDAGCWEVPFHCANLQADTSNCGGCGHACATGELCTRGICTPIDAGVTDAGMAGPE